VALTLAFLAGLLGVFLGERVLADPPALRMSLVGAGVLLALGSTVRRALCARAAQVDRRSVERLLLALQLVGLAGLAAYALGTSAVLDKLHVALSDARGRERIQDSLSVLWPILVACSTVPLLFAERAFAPMRTAQWIEARRVRGSMSAGLELALCGCWLVALGYVFAERDVKYDASYFRTSRPSESTQAIVKSLAQPLEVLLFFPPVNEVKEEVEDYARGLGAATGRAQVSGHDRLLEPKLAEKHRVSKDGTIVLATGDKRETLTLPVELDAARTKLRTLDQDVQKALLKLVRERRKVLLTTGHGEINDPPQGPAAGAERAEAKDFKKLLELQNFTMRTLGIADGLANEVPADAAVVCVLGPSRPLLPEEAATLRRYAEGGGSLLLALDAQFPEASASLAPVLEALDLKFDPAPLANEHMHVLRRRNESDVQALYSNRYSSHPSVSTLSRHSRELGTVMLGAGSLRRLSTGSNPTHVDFTIRAMPETFADTNANYAFDAKSEKRDTYNLAAAVERKLEAPTEGDKKDNKGKAPKDKAKEKTAMRAVVLADADGLSDEVLRNLGNLYLAADSLRWLAGDEQFAGDVSSEEDVRIEHTKKEDVTLFYATIFAVPALVLGGGLTYTWRRRRRGGTR
jgi:gliding motility-associatede transport system auxiliary component